MGRDPTDATPPVTRERDYRRRATVAINARPSQSRLHKKPLEELVNAKVVVAVGLRANQGRLLSVPGCKEP